MSTEALSSTEPCGNELPLVPAQGRVDTVIKPLLVQVRGLWRRKMGWIWEQGANSPWGAGQEHPDMKPGGDPGDTGTGRSLLLTDSGAASSQPGGILVEKAHSSLLCQEGRTAQGCLTVLWNVG